MADDDEASQVPAPPPPPPAPAAGTPPPQVVYQVVAAQANGMATAALVLGIVGVVVALIPLFFWLGWILGLLAVIFGAIGIGRANAGAGHKSSAVAGLVLGIVAIVLGVVILAVIISAVGDASDKFNQIGQQIGG